MPCPTKFLTIKPIKKTTPRSGFLEQYDAREARLARAFEMEDRWFGLGDHRRYLRELWNLGLIAPFRLLLRWSVTPTG